MPERTLIRTLVAAVIATAIGIFIGIGVINWFPSQASAQAHNTDHLYYVMVVVSVPIFVLVCTVILYSVWQFHMKPGEELRDGPPIHGNTRLEMIWTALPSVLILGLVAYSFVVLHDNERKPAGPEMQVNVTGQQFAWSYEYPASATGGKPLTTYALYLPEGESVKFNMQSRDVIHAFWVPDFRVQEDVVPGVTTHYRVTPTRLGTYDVICNELCGLGHALMRSTVHVVTPAQFHAWLAAQQSPKAAPAGSAPAGGQVSGSGAAGGSASTSPAAGAAPGQTTPAALGPITNSGGAASASNAALVSQGRQIFASSAGCTGCHTLADAHSAGTVGPNLDHVLVGAKHNRGFIATSIANPGAYVEPGFPNHVMPNFGSTLSRRQIQALVSYLLKVTHS